jgi:hypothetical protein
LGETNSLTVTTVRLDFSIVEVADLLNSSHETLPHDQLLLQSFPPPHPHSPDGSFCLVDVATVYVDKEDCVVAWYITNPFSTRRSVGLSLICTTFYLTKSSRSR